MTSLFLSGRAQQCLSMFNPVSESNSLYRNNPWSTENPDGYVSLSVADNNLCRDVLTKRLGEDDLKDVLNQPEIFYYPKHGGTVKTLDVFSKFITKYFNCERPVDSENLCAVPGATCGFDMIGSALCNPHDAILCPAPYYVRIFNDFSEKSQVKIVSVPIQSDNEHGFHGVTVESISKTYDEVTQKGIAVRAILLLNPHNPTGTVANPEKILEIMEFAKTKNMVVIMNEIYALSIFDENTGFRSILNWWSKIPDPEKVVWIWGMSKDFCTPGLRFALLYSENKKLTECFKRYEYIQPTSAILQKAICKLVSDYDWVDNFFTENRSRLRSAFERVHSRLNEIGVPHTISKGGFFTFINLRKFMKEQTFAEEQILNEKLLHNRLLLVPGEWHKCSQPGWFRLVFTGQPPAVEEGLNRLQRTLCEIKRQHDLVEILKS